MKIILGKEDNGMDVLLHAAVIQRIKELQRLGINIEIVIEPGIMSMSSLISYTSKHIKNG